MNKTFYAYKKELSERLLDEYELTPEQLDITQDSIRNNFNFGLSVQGYLFSLEKDYGIVSKEEYKRRKQQRQTA